MNKFININWSEQEINEYVDLVGVLVLFEIEISLFSREAKIIVHGKMNTWDRESLRDDIIKKYGGKDITDEIGIRVNEYAEKWYNKKILKRKARVLNKSR
jgi:hypothetical protein